MTDLEEINGIGPGRADTLEEDGYHTAEDVANAKPENIGEIIQAADGGEIVSNAQAIADKGDIDGESVDEEEDDSVEEETEPEEPGDIEVVFDMDLSTTQRNHVIGALLNEEIKTRRTNRRDKRELVQEAVNMFIEGDHPYELTLEQLNTLYRGLNEIESEYRSTRGLSSFVGEIRSVKNEVQELRSENWPR